MNNHRQTLLWIFTLTNTLLVIFLLYQSSSAKTPPGSQDIPQLLGSWTGPNQTISDLKGYRFWGEKTIHITEQKDRRFRGHFNYPDGTINFFGVIYPDNKSFTWVASNSRGYNHGRVLAEGRISACYVESWEQATAGCAELSLTGKAPAPVARQESVRY